MRIGVCVEGGLIENHILSGPSKNVMPCKMLILPCTMYNDAGREVLPSWLCYKVRLEDNTNAGNYRRGSRVCFVLLFNMEDSSFFLCRHFVSLSLSLAVH